MYFTIGCVLQEKYNLQLPTYPGTSSCVRIGGSGQQKQRAGTDIAAMRQSYDKGGLTEEQAHSNPYVQFDRCCTRVRSYIAELGARDAPTCNGFCQVRLDTCSSSA